MNQSVSGVIYFRALEGLRGIAAITVLLFHILISFAGYLAVDFFLVLSGFILAHRYLYGSRPISAGEFIVSRLARLYPMHLFGLLAFTVVMLLLAHDVPRYPDGTLFTFIQQLTLTQNIGLNPHGQTWNMPSWSISVEFWLNLLFFCYVRRTTSSLTLLLMSVASLTVIFNLSGILDTTYQNYFQVLNSGLLRGWASFTLVILAYRGWMQIRNNSWSQGSVTAIELLLCSATLAIFILGLDRLRSLQTFAPVLFAAVILVFALEQGRISKACGRFQWLGKISYSIYLNHLVVIILVNTLLDRFGQSHPPFIPLYLLLTLALSAATYRWIELPGRLALQRLLPSRKPQREEALV